MYEQVFGLSNRPFTSTPYVQNYFPADSIHHALSQIRLTIERAAGPSIVTGAAGTGKSLLLAMLNESFKQSCQVVNLVCANVVERRDLLQAILFELGLPYKAMSEGELRLSLIDYLKSNEDSIGSLLLVDEAHTLAAEILDELRVITNFARDGRPVISLVLAGLPALEDRLIETKSESLNQRIASRCYLTNLSRNETFEYIVTHLERAGGNGETIFTGDAINLIHDYSDGCPRIINQVCDYALVLGASQNCSRISAEIAVEAWKDVQSIPDAVAPVPTKDAASHDDDLMVIEFGTLDSENNSNEISSFEESQDDSDLPTILSVESSKIFEQEVDFDFSEDSKSISNAKPQENLECKLQGLTEEHLDSNTAPQPPAFDYSIADDDDQDDRLNDFQNPFNESFQEEETVYAAYIPTVSEQNISSLMITSEELCLLEKLQATEEVVQSAIPEPFAVAAPTIEDMPTESEIPVYQDLKMTPEALEGLVQVEQDVRNLQRDLMFTQQEFSSKAVHPDYEYFEEPQSVESVGLNPGEDETPDKDLADIVSDETPKELPTIQFEQPMLDSVLTEGVNDDRDIMIISQPERFDVELDSDEEPSFEGDNYISTGNAQRMDYTELFRQLRSAT